MKSILPMTLAAWLAGCATAPPPLAPPQPVAEEGALLRMKADRQIGPLRVFIQQLERLLQP